MTRAQALVLAAVLAAVWFAGLGHRVLAKPDEARQGEISREMVASGDWVTPRLNGFKYFEKPPLQYWATAAAFELFGAGQWQTRLWPALTGLLGILLVFFAANRALGPPAGLYAAAALAGSSLYVLFAHVATLDMGVSLFLSAAVFFTLVAQIDETPVRARRGWMLAAWAAMGLAVLSKGLIGIVLPAGGVGLYMLWNRDWRLLARFHLLPGLALLLAICVPWFVAVSLANPEFPRFFFIHEHFERFLTREAGRYGPPWYYLPVLAIGIMPWLPALVTGVLRGAREREPLRFRPLRFLLAWCAVVFVFFSISHSKLPGYILPIFPALAALVGWQLSRASPRLLVGQALLAAACGLGVAGAALGLQRFVPSGSAAYPFLASYRPWMMAAGLASMGLALAAALIARSSRRGYAVLLAAAGFALTELPLLGFQAMAGAYSTYDIAREVRPMLAPGVPFYTVDAYDHTMPFYLGRTVTMVGYKDELGPGIAAEPSKFVPDLESFVRRWRGDSDAFALMKRKDEPRILPLIGGHVVASDSRFVVVRKR